MDRCYCLARPDCILSTITPRATAANLIGLIADESLSRTRAAMILDQIQGRSNQRFVVVPNKRGD